MSDWIFYKIKIYLLAGRLLHIITIIELMIIIVFIPILYKIDTTQDILLTGLRYYAMAFLASLPIFSQLDARSRYQNYKQIKDQIFIYGFDTRILKLVLKSKCQRDAATVSASELGLKKECIKYFKSIGYKWYHLLPDFIFSKPQFLFSKYFWNTTFFVSRYRPKVDYSSVQIQESKISHSIAPANA